MKALTLRVIKTLGFKKGSQIKNSFELSVNQLVLFNVWTSATIVNKKELYYVYKVIGFKSRFVKFVKLEFSDTPPHCLLKTRKIVHINNAWFNQIDIYKFIKIDTKYVKLEKGIIL